MARKKGEATRKLSEEGWEALWLLYETAESVPVAKLCELHKVSRARFYKKYGARIKAKARSATTASGPLETTGAPASDASTPSV